jgi:hypothetical protein
LDSAACAPLKPATRCPLAFLPLRYLQGGALLLDAPGIGGAVRAGSGAAAGGPWSGAAGAGGLGAGSGAPSTLLDLSIAPIDRTHASNRTLGASGRLQQLLAGGDGRMSLGGASDAGSGGGGGDGSMLELNDGHAGAARGKAASAAAKRVSFAPTGGQPDGDDRAAGPSAGAGGNPNNVSMFSDDGDDGNGYLSSAAFGGGGDYGGDDGDMGAAYGPSDGQYDGHAEGAARAAAADDDDHVPVLGDALGGVGGPAGGRLTRAGTGALSAAALRALGLYGDAAGAADAAVDKWAQLDPLADAGPATHRPYKKGRTFLKLRDPRLVSHAGPVAAAAAAMQAAASCGNKGVRDARDLAARAAALSQKVALARTLGAKPGAAGRAAAASATASLALALTGASGASAAAVSSTSAGAAPSGAAALPRRLVSSQLQALAAAVWPRLATGSSGGARASAASLSASMAVLSLSAPLAAELEPLFRRQKAAALQARLATRKAAAKASAAAAAAGAAYAMTAESGEEEEEGGMDAGGAYAGSRAGVDAHGRPVPYGGDGDGGGYYEGGGDWGAYAGDGGDDDDEDGPWGGSAAAGAAAGGAAPGAPSSGGEGDANGRAAGLGAADLASGAASAAGGAEGASSQQAAAAAAEQAAAQRPRSLFSWLDDADAAAELVRGTGLEAAAVWDRLGMGLHGTGHGNEEGADEGLFGGASYTDLVRQHMKTIVSVGSPRRAAERAGAEMESGADSGRGPGSGHGLLLQRAAGYAGTGFRRLACADTRAAATPGARIPDAALWESA